MKDLDKAIFISLFNEACQKCFGFPLTSPLSETDSKLLSNKIFEQTGLVIGPKSIKNYSFYVQSNNGKERRNENPSVATLDTFARYVLDALHTDEIKRKDTESHYPYWFQYRGRFSNAGSIGSLPKITGRNAGVIILAILVIVIGFFVIQTLSYRNRHENFTDNFNSVQEDSLKDNGWIIKAMDTTWWKLRNEKPDFLTLFTLRGDNWANNENLAEIKNLLMRRINSDCFAVEIHLKDFIPIHNWQQAGILLSEDSSFTGKMLRLSISYNDFFGGYEKAPEIIIQVVSSLEGSNHGMPEEIAHIAIFNIEPGNENLVAENLTNAVLKIEKSGNHFRFLYTISPTESFAFKEAVSVDYNIQPEYISLFAIQGWANNVNTIPVHFDSFSLAAIPCDK